jgi:hypothetical protein
MQAANKHLTTETWPLRSGVCFRRSKATNDSEGLRGLRRRRGRSGLCRLTELIGMEPYSWSKEPLLNGGLVLGGLPRSRFGGFRASLLSCVDWSVGG